MELDHGPGPTDGAAVYSYGPPEWHDDNQSGPPGIWRTETQSGEAWNTAYTSSAEGTAWGAAAEAETGDDDNHMALLERLGTEPRQQAESPPVPDMHQVLRRVSGNTDGVNRAQGGVDLSPDGANGTPESWRGYQEDGVDRWYREDYRGESGNAETLQSAESAEGRTTADGGMSSSNNEGDRSEGSSSGLRNEDTEGQEIGQPSEFAASRTDAAGADENPDAADGSRDGDPVDPQGRRRGWRVGRSDQPTALVDAEVTEPTAASTEPAPGGTPVVPPVVEDNRPLGPLPPSLVGYRLKRAPMKSPPTPIPKKDELAAQEIAKPVPIQRMPARRRIAPVEEAVSWFWLLSSFHEALPVLQFKNLAKSVWALSKLSVKDMPLLDSCAHQVQQSSAHFQPHQLAMLAWSFASLGRCVEGVAAVMTALAESARQHVEELNARSLSNMAWGHAKLQQNKVPLMTALAASAVPLLVDFGAQALRRTSPTCFRPLLSWLLTRRPYWPPSLHALLMLQCHDGHRKR
eukprot:s692_g6.t1